MAEPAPALLALYLYDDGHGGVLPPHPSARTSSLVRYLECALTQVASLRLTGGECEVTLVTNLDERRLGGRERRLYERLLGEGVELRPTSFDHGNAAGHASWGCLRDALLAACEGSTHQRTVWVPNLDCVFVSPVRLFAAAPAAGEVGALFIPYPPEWKVGSGDAVFATRRALGALVGLAGDAAPPPWVGADLLCGTAEALRALVDSCDALRTELAGQGHRPGAERLLGLVAARGTIGFRDLSHVAERIHTGARHSAAPSADPLSLGLWHLPAEKGLSLRRAAGAVARGRTERLRRDLNDPALAARRFNVGRTHRLRQARDDAWLALQKVLLDPRVRRLIRTRAALTALALAALACAAMLGGCGDAQVGSAHTSGTSSDPAGGTGTDRAHTTTSTQPIPGTSVHAGSAPGKGLPGATAQAPRRNAEVAKIDARSDKVLAEGKVHIAAGAPSDAEVRKEIELAKKAGIQLPKGDSAQSFENAPSNAGGGIEAEIPVTVWNPRSKPIATWIIPILQWAYEHGWNGTVTSGYRTFYEQAQLNAAGLFSAPAGFSNHEKTIYPGGAVDVTDPGQLIDVLKRYGGPVKLVGGVLGAVDPEHFSATGD